MKKSKVDILVGAQWGDEGKGKVVDVMGGDFDVFVRYQGGSNAGHTVMVNGKKIVFSSLPSGMLHPGKLCIIGNGVAIEPEQVLSEIARLYEEGQDRARLVISPAAHVVMPYHPILEKAEDASRGKRNRIESSGQGIDRCYLDKTARCGIRVEDLLDADVLRDKLTKTLEEKNHLLTRLFNAKPMSFDEVYEPAREWGKKLAPYVEDVMELLNDAIKDGKNILFEGAQGTLVDIDHGTYPYVTSSSTSAAGALTGTGLAPRLVGRVIAVAKAYTARAGEGAMPTEDVGEAGNFLRDHGGEFKQEIGRSRRCGWLDLVALKYSVRLNGVEALALTKLDVLSGISKIKVCTAYEINGVRKCQFSTNLRTLEEAIPVYETMPSWSEDISSCRTFESLPEAARNFVLYIEKQLGVPVSLIGVGPDRSQTINRGF